MAEQICGAEFPVSRWDIQCMLSLDHPGEHIHYGVIPDTDGDVAFRMSWWDESSDGHEHGTQVSVFGRCLTCEDLA